MSLILMSINCYLNDVYNLAVSLKSGPYELLYLLKIKNNVRQQMCR